MTDLPSLLVDRLQQLRKVTISFVVSPHPSARPRARPHETPRDTFSEILYRGFLLNFRDTLYTIFFINRPKTKTLCGHSSQHIAVYVISTRNLLLQYGEKERR